jgi:hypothetical protein
MQSRSVLAVESFCGRSQKTREKESMDLTGNHNGRKESRSGCTGSWKLEAAFAPDLLKRDKPCGTAFLFPPKRMIFETRRECASISDASPGQSTEACDREMRNPQLLDVFLCRSRSNCLSPKKKIGRRKEDEPVPVAACPRSLAFLTQEAFLQKKDRRRELEAQRRRRARIRRKRGRGSIAEEEAIHSPSEFCSPSPPCERRNERTDFKQKCL